MKVAPSGGEPNAPASSSLPDAAAFFAAAMCSCSQARRVSQVQPAKRLHVQAGLRTSRCGCLFSRMLSTYLACCCQLGGCTGLVVGRKAMLTCRSGLSKWAPTPATQHFARSADKRGVSTLSTSKRGAPWRVLQGP